MTLRIWKVAFLILLATIFSPSAPRTSLVLLAHDYGGSTDPDEEPDDDDDDCDGDSGEQVCGDGGECDSGNEGDPVDLATGEESHRAVDLMLENYISVRIARSYNSQSEYDSPLGYGWSTTYNRRLFKRPDGSVVMRLNCGSRRVFLWSGGGYVTPGGLVGTLTENPDGTFVYEKKGGWKDHYDIEGKLVKIEHPSGASLVLTYDPAGRLPLIGVSPYALDTTTPTIVARDYRTTRIEEVDPVGVATGLFVDFTYDPTTGRLSTASDSLGRTVTYQHDLYGNLTQVTDAGAVDSFYDYSPPVDHNLTSFAGGTCPACPSFTNVYDTQDRVVQQVVAGSTLDITYDVPGTQTTVLHSVFDESGTTLLRQSTTIYQFNIHGNPTSITYDDGSVTNLIRVNDNGTTTRDMKVAREEFWYDNAGTPTLLKAKDYEYDTEGRLTRDVVTLDSGEVMEQRYAPDADRLASIETVSSLDPGKIYRTEYDYVRDGNGNPLRVSRVRQVKSYGPPIQYSETAFEYDAQGRLTATIDPVGRRTVLVYGGDPLGTQGKPTKIYHDTGAEDPNDRWLFEYDAAGNQTKRTDPNGNIWTFAFDSENRLIQEIDPLGQETVYEYSGKNVVRVEENRLPGQAGRATQFEYDSHDRLTRMLRETPMGNQVIVAYTFDTDGVLRTRADGLGNSYAYAYDSLGRLTQVSDPTGGVTQAAYDAAGRLTAKTDPVGRTETFSYDDLDRLTSKTDKTGNVTTMEYDVLNHLTRLVRPGGNISTFEFDLLARPVAETNAAGQTKTMEYDDAGQITRLINFKGLATGYAYDAFGRRSAATDETLGQTVNYLYDYAGHITGTIDAGGMSRSMVYDTLGRLSISSDALGNSISFAYDNIGRTTMRTDALGRVASMQFDPFDRMVQVTDPAGGVATYEYDGAGHLTRRVDPGGSQITYGYDGMGRLTARSYDPGAAWAFAYDAAGQLTSKTNPRGEVTAFEYDAMGRRTKATFADLTTETREFDSLGNLTRTIDPATDLTIAYDSLGRPTGITDAGYSPAKVMGLEYDAHGNLTRVIDPESVVTDYGYDGLDRLVSVTSPAGTATMEYDSHGRKTKAVLGNGSFTEYGYDGAGRLTSLVNRKSDLSLISSAAYTFDAAGNITGTTLDSGDSLAYGYDALNQLTSETRTGSLAYSRSYSYDAAGNRTQAVRDGVTTSYSYGPGNQMLQEVTGADVTSYSYDTAGNLTQKADPSGSTSYGYDLRDRLVALDAPGTTNDATYTYDAFRRRIRRVQGAIDQRFFYDGLGMATNLIAEYDAGGNPVARYDSFDISGHLSMTRGGQSYYFLRDNTWSVRHVLDASENVVNDYQYEAFGGTVAASETVANPYRFTGYYFDSEKTGYQARFRDYDPAVGRFQSFDPIGPAMSANLYSYVNNRPLLLVDPLGLLGWKGEKKSDCVSNGIEIDLGQYVGKKLGPIGSKLVGAGFSKGAKFAFNKETCSKCCSKGTARAGAHVKDKEYSIEAEISFTSPPIPVPSPFGPLGWVDPASGSYAGFVFKISLGVSGKASISTDKCNNSYKGGGCVTGSASVAVLLGIGADWDTSMGDVNDGAGSILDFHVEGMVKLSVSICVEGSASGISATIKVCGTGGIYVKWSFFWYSGSYTVVEVSGCLQHKFG